MTRVFGFLLGLLVLPAFALAQSSNGTETTPPSTFSMGPIPVQLFELDGQTYADLQHKPVNNDQCERDAEIVFRLTMLNQVPPGTKYLQLWVGNNCNISDNRDQVGESDCDRMDVPASWQITKIMDDYHTTVGPICALGDGELYLYFLPAANTTEASGTVQVYGQYKLTIDKVAPNAPANVEAGQGETEIPIKWTVTDTNDVFNNYLIWDTEPVNGGATTDADGGTTVDVECNSSILKEGDATDLDALAKNPNIRIQEVMKNVDHTTVSGDDLGARRVAMAVVAGDLAGNLSTMSNVDCLQVVATDGFWDAYKAAGGTAETGCACSTPGTRVPLASGIVPMALVALAWGVRRRVRKGSRS